MVRLTISVSDISVVWSVGFRYILIYRADTETGTYTYLNYVALSSSTSSYTYTDVGGISTNWYKSKYTDVTPPSTPSLESSYSDAVEGETAELFHNITYPTEVSLGTTDENRIKKIRIYIGDQKKLKREYISECYSSVQDDGKTYMMESKGWPVYISLDNVNKTTMSDPYVDGYRYLTFSGTINTISGALDLYYYKFRWSDREILEHYSLAMIPPGLTSTTVTEDHMILQTSIDLLEAENWEDYIENGASIDDSDTSWDPSPGFRARESAIGRLQKRLDNLIKQYMLASDGYRLD